jgi:hypothetical protein
MNGCTIPSSVKAVSKVSSTSGLGISSGLRILLELGVLEEVVGLIVELEDIELGDEDRVLLQPSSTLEFKSSKLGEVNTGDFITSFPFSDVKY